MSHPDLDDPNARCLDRWLRRENLGRIVGGPNEDGLYQVELTPPEPATFAAQFLCASCNEYTPCRCVG